MLDRQSWLWNNVVRCFHGPRGSSVRNVQSRLAIPLLVVSTRLFHGAETGFVRFSGLFPPSRARRPAVARMLDGAGYQATLAAVAVFVTTHRGLEAAGWSAAGVAAGTMGAWPVMVLVNRTRQRYTGAVQLFHVGVVGVSAAARIFLVAAAVSSVPVLVLALAAAFASVASWPPDLQTKDRFLEAASPSMGLAWLLTAVAVAHTVGAAAPTLVSDPTVASVCVAVGVVGALCVLPTVFLTEPARPSSTGSEVSFPTLEVSTGSSALGFRFMVLVFLLALATHGPVVVWASLTTFAFSDAYVSLASVTLLAGALLAPRLGRFVSSRGPRAPRYVAVLALLVSMLWLAAGVSVVVFMGLLALNMLLVIVVVEQVLSESRRLAHSSGMAQATTSVAAACVVAAVCVPALYNLNLFGSAFAGVAVFGALGSAGAWLAARFV